MSSLWPAFQAPLQNVSTPYSTPLIENGVFNPRVTATRASDTTYIDSDGLLKVAGDNEFPVDYSQGFPAQALFEGSTNLLLHSQDLTNAYYTSFTASRALSSVDSIISGKKAMRMTLTSTTGGFFRAASFPTGTNTISIFAKAGTCDTLTISVDISSNGYAVDFDLTAGTAGTPYIRGTGGIVTPVNAWIDNFGNGWYRCSFAATTASTNNAAIIMTGASSETIDLDGIQLEAKPYPTPYIPTNGSTASRAQPSVSIVGTNFSSFYNQSEGTFVIDYLQPNIATPTARLFQFDNGNDNTKISVFEVNGTNARFAVDDGGVSQVIIDSTINNVGTQVKTAIAYKENDFAIVTTGETVNTDTSGSVSTVDRLFITNRSDLNRPASAYIKSITYYPRRLSNEQLEDLTAPKTINLLSDGQFSTAVTKTRASETTYIDSDGLLKVAGDNEFPVDYSQGFPAQALFEGSENLKTHSQEILATNGYSSVNSSLTSVVQDNPFEGQSSVTKFALNNGANTGNNPEGWNFGAILSLSNSTIYTQSIFAKADGVTVVRLRSNGTGQVFDIPFSGSLPSPTGAISAVTREDYGNGWFRFSWTFTTGSSAPSNRGDGWAIKSDVADGTSGFFVTGAQIEQKPYPTPLIITGSSTASRAAPSISVTGSSFSGFYNQNQGTFVLDYLQPFIKNFSRLLEVSNGFFDERINIESSNINQNSIFNVRDNGTFVAQIDSGVDQHGNRKKVAATYKENDCAIVATGGSVATDTSVTIPNVDRLAIGRESAGTPIISNFYIANLTYYPLRLSNSKLEDLTT